MESFDGIVEFVAIAQNNGFSAAAKQLGCSASHVSRQLAKLEERLACTLVARTTRQVSLTESGHRYYQHCKDLVIGLQQANEQISEQQVRLSGTLRVSAAGGFAEHYIAPALMRFAEQHPELCVDIDFDSRLVNFVEEGYDFAVRYGELSDSSLVARQLVCRSMMAVASPDYLAEHGTPVYPAQLKHHSCIIANTDSWRFEHSGSVSTIRVKGRWRSNNTNTIRIACEQGLGIAYMPKSTFSAAVNAGKLIPILRPYWGGGASSWVVYQNKRFLPLRARLAIEFLVNYFRHWQEHPIEPERADS